MSQFRALWRIFLAAFRQQTAYLGAQLAGLFTNAVFGLLKVGILLAAVRSNGGEVAGYDYARMLSYVWVTQAMLGSVDLHGRSALTERVKSGAITTDFLRPVDVQLAALAHECGRGTFALLPRGLPLVAIGIWWGNMATPTGAMWALGVLSVGLAILVSTACGFLVAVSGFWLVETRGVSLLYSVISAFLAGLFLPIELFPNWLYQVAVSTPFPAILMYPSRILSTRATGLEALELVGLQLAWLALVLGIGAVLLRFGRRRLEVQGG